ncbi:MAG: threonine--tRNA ligase [bacterium]
MPKSQDLNKLNKIRHSLAHILALAVQELYSGAKFGIGPSIKNGFYYDFDDLKISDSDLQKIENKMREIIKQDLEFKKKIISKIQAKKIFKNQPYKLELIKDLDKIIIYQVGNFIDLCAGPHVKNTKKINPKAFKLEKLAGAYWRGSEKNPMLTRIYGLAFETEQELKNYLEQQEQAEKRDHRKLGQKLDLFSFHDEGPGFVFWHPKGLFIREKLIKYWRQEHKKAGYQEISTPFVLKQDLWQTSKHMRTYKENMYFSKIDKDKYVIKPMNCPGGLLIYKEKPHSYRELPMRVAELGLVHRHELAGVLHGLFRVRAFTQDDAHIYCTKEQIEDELKKVLKLTQKIYKKFGFKKWHLELSTRPEKYTGDLKMWSLAEKILEKVLRDLKLDYKINPGDGAFYGPKIDSHLEDAIGRTWQCGTVQLDFAQPENFKLEYINKSGKKQRPVMIHRTIYGSLERFIGVLLEHYAGSLPFWLSPEQIWILPISQKHKKYAKQIFEKLSDPLFNSPFAKGGKQEGFRVKIIDSDETLGKKIRDGELQKIPYLLIVGDQEIKNKTITIRERGEKQQVKTNIKNFILNAISAKN